MKITQIPPEDIPKSADLPGELARIALAMDEQFPGMGARITLALAQMFGGQALYIRKADPILRRLRDRAIRKRYDQGDVSVSDLVRMFGLSQSHLYSILGRPEEDEKQMRMF